MIEDIVDFENREISSFGGVSNEDAIKKLTGRMKRKIADLLGGTVLLIICLNERLVYEIGN